MSLLDFHYGRKGFLFQSASQVESDLVKVSAMDPLCGQGHDPFRAQLRCPAPNPGLREPETETMSSYLLDAVVCLLVT